MSVAVALDPIDPTTPSSGVRMQQLPLTFLKAGESAHVVRVRDKGEIHHHLENLGFVAGAAVKVISEQSGNLIVEIKGSQVALNRSVASKIIAN